MFEGLSHMAVIWIFVSLAVMVVLFLISTMARLYRKAGPHEALIVYGMGGTRVVKGHGTVVLPMTIASSTNGSVLTLTGDLTGTSSGTSTTSGTLSNGVVVGSWSLTPGAKATGCNAGTGDFVMCQGKATCSTTAAAAVKRF